MADNIPDAFRRGTLYTDNENYTFVKLPIASSVMALDFLKSCHDSDATASAFQTFVLDKDEITMMIPTSSFESKFKAMSDKFPTYEQGNIQYRIITFDVVLAPTLVGFMAVVTRALADANVSVLPFAAYSRDHVFVSEKDFDTAMQVLERLKTITIN
jgi:hypothetical protein